MSVTVRSLAKYLRSSQAIFCGVLLLYYVGVVRQGDFGGDRVRKETEAWKKELNFVISLCGGSQPGSQGRKSSKKTETKILETNVMLKSVVLLTRRRLHFHVISDSRQMFGRLVNSTANWPHSYRRKLRFSLLDVSGSQDQATTPTPPWGCTAQTLFLPVLAPDIQRVIYLDTDIIFMRPPEDLWSLFDTFSSSHMMAMATSMAPSTELPSLDSGVMLMELERMRSLSEGWSETMTPLHSQQSGGVPSLVSHTLSILFRLLPASLSPLPCEWNYRAEACAQTELRCAAARNDGASLLHGSYHHSVKAASPDIARLTEVFTQLLLGEDSLYRLGEGLEAALVQAESESPPPRCQAGPGLGRALLGELRNRRLGE